MIQVLFERYHLPIGAMHMRLVSSQKKRDAPGIRGHSSDTIRHCKSLMPWESNPNRLNMSTDSLSSETKENPTTTLVVGFLGRPGQAASVVFFSQEGTRFRPTSL